MSNSATVAAGDQALASQYNNLRKDVALDNLYYIGNTAGSSNAYTGTMDGQCSAYTDGMTVVGRANFTNSGSATINLTPSGGSALGAKTIKKNYNANLESGDIPSGFMFVLKYDSTQGVFQIIFVGYDMTSANKLTLTNGSNADSLHIHGPLAHVDFTTTFETSGRFTTAVGAGGTVTFGTSGVVVALANTVNSFSSVLMNLGTDLFKSDLVFSAKVQVNGSTGVGANTNSSFIGIGTPTVAGSGHTYTVRHIGFKFVRSATDLLTLSATQADGTTESASSLATNISIGDTVDLQLRKVGASIKYYYRVNGGSWSAGTTITTNIPGASTTQLQISSSDNADDNSQLNITCYGMSLKSYVS